MNRKLVVIDAKGHLLGRMASYVAKQIEQGQKVVIVRCESTLISGKHFRNKLNFMDYLHKRTNSNPKWGPYHLKRPSMMVYKAIRGMISRKTKKGQAALARLRCFDGCPMSMNTKKRMCIPDALKAVRLAPRSKYSVLGEVCKECGWNKSELVDRLEKKRLAVNCAWHKKRVDRIKKEKAALKKDKDMENVNKELAKYGY